MPGAAALPAAASCRCCCHHVQSSLTAWHPEGVYLPLLLPPAPPSAVSTAPPPISALPVDPAQAGSSSCHPPHLLPCPLLCSPSKKETLPSCHLPHPYCLTPTAMLAVPPPPPSAAPLGSSSGTWRATSTPPPRASPRSPPTRGGPSATTASPPPPSPAPPGCSGRSRAPPSRSGRGLRWRWGGGPWGGGCL